MRFSVFRFCYEKLPKNYSNFPEKYIKKQTEFISYRTPPKANYVPTIERWRKRAYYGLERPWTKEFQEQNAPNVFQPYLYIEPIRDFYVFRGDRVEILRGKDKGKHGIVNYVVLERNWVCVEGLNLKYKILNRTRNNPGVLHAEEMPLLVPRDVALVDPSDRKATKVEWRFDEEGKKVRVSLRTGRIIPLPLEAFETYDYKTKETYKEQPKDTKAKDVTEITFEPRESKTFEMDLMDEFGIKEQRIPHEFYCDKLAGQEFSANCNDLYVMEKQSNNNKNEEWNKNVKKSFRSKCFEERKRRGLFMLDKRNEDKIYRMKKTLKKSGKDGHEIRRIINEYRRKEENKARKNMKKRCLMCRKSDHLLANCPKAEKSEDVDETLAVCFRCGSTEHKLRECTNSSKNLDFVRCFVCREKGHLSRNCPKNDKGVYPKGGACKKCGSKDHLVKDCPQAEVADDEAEFTLPTLSDGMSADAEFSLSNTKKQKKAKVVSF